MDRSCPRSPAKAVSICENTPEISDKASHSTRSPETNRAESLCFRLAPSVPYPISTTQAQPLPDSLRHACTATGLLRESGRCPGAPFCFLLWALTNISGSVPTHHPAPLHRHYRSAKRSLSLVRDGASP